MFALLTNEQMRAADAATISAGTAGIVLMEAAGAAVAERAAQLAPAPGPILILCGTGNNGGDGFVAARLLAEKGYQVRLSLIGECANLQGDALLAAQAWPGEVHSFEAALVSGNALIVDALFGSGLSRDVEGQARAVIEAVNASGVPVLAVDIPSGVDGNSGKVMGVAMRAQETVTFFRLKPGHFLLPGRAFCGAMHLAQIGLSPDVLASDPPTTFLNRPDVWFAHYPRPGLESHKYTRGHALIAAGSSMTGAARLAARAALRAGAGVVTLAANPNVLPVYQTALEAVIVHPMADADAYAALLTDARRNALLVGPGAGLGQETRELARLALATGRSVVLDADALTSFEALPRALFSAIGAHERDVVLTPHGGEFKRLFAHAVDEQESKLDKARNAAKVSGAVVVFKGADTVVAAPDGRAVIADNAPPFLATAGAGDVLAGIITGLLAQGMKGFEAACAAVWLHGEAAAQIGPGLISEDLPDALIPVLRRLLSYKQG